MFVYRRVSELKNGVSVAAGRDVVYTLTLYNIPMPNDV